MSGRGCDKVVEKLVEYADGVLPAAEAAEVAEHLRVCPRCRAQVGALRRSLAVAGAIWADAAADVAESGEPRAGRRGGRGGLWRIGWRAGLVAAGIMLLAGTWFWQRASEPRRPAVHVAGASSPSDVAREIARVGVSAELMQAADMLAEQPAGREIACERYQYIASAYQDTPAGVESDKRYRSLCDQRSLP